ncbi:uncharacterized protein CTRU02_207588 [Colletotrichum truncatum]|uniref:Uncharacterized protein n=1 Tax=Colletotrichum truncatum TaxID=5467 RepID=A0ACC3Z188_COLTU|nr:uncharacterized protein CTRU02_09312 [Colletotrichum truncatum]KAF6788990.1 hypothetical protein CTRU02_09312 [Colletotrichum truncatum]
MGRPYRQVPDINLHGPHQTYAYQYDRPATASTDIYPPRGRSPGPRHRNRPEPAAASHDNYDRIHSPRGPQDGREHRKDRRERKDLSADEHNTQVDPRRNHNTPKNRFVDDEDKPYPKPLRSHGRSAGGSYRTAHDYEDSDAYSPGSHHAHERQHAYHPPRTSETRRSRYPDYDTEPRSTDKRRSRYTDDAEPHASDRRRSRHADYRGGVSRDAEKPHRAKHPDSEVDPRSHQRDRSLKDHRRSRKDSPDPYFQSTRQHSARGRSVPRNSAVRGATGAARPRAKSAVGYAALGEAAQTAFRVGSQAAYQMRNEPGPWIGEKGTRVATAALGAALVDTFVGHKAANMKGGMRHQALRQACEMGIRNFVMQPAVNSANHRNGSGSKGGRKRR